MEHSQPTALEKAKLEASRKYAASEKGKAKQEAWNQANKEKLKAKREAWYQANKQKLSESKKKYREDHVEEEKARSEAWYKANKQKVSEKQKKYREEHLEEDKCKKREWERTAKGKKTKDEWRVANPDKPKEYRNRWKKRNPERAYLSRRGASIVRRARFSAGFDSDTGDWEDIIRGDPCAYCGGPFEHIDHIQPLAKNGEHSPMNLTSSCAACNLSKNTRSLLHFLLSRGV